MMRIFGAIRWFAAALIATSFVAAPSSSQAATGTVAIEIVRGGFIIGVSGGSGTLRFAGRSYPLSVGGVSVGAIIGAAGAQLVGRAYNMRRPSDIAGTYTAAGAGVAVIRGPSVVRLRNANGVILELRGRQVGLEFSLDVSGIVIGLR
jgi:hypothetical protein